MISFCLRWGGGGLRSIDIHPPAFILVSASGSSHRGILQAGPRLLGFMHTKQRYLEVCHSSASHVPSGVYVSD